MRRKTHQSAYYYDNDNNEYQQESWFSMGSIKDNEKDELPSKIKTKLFCVFNLLLCASFYNHLKILPLISCTTIVLKHALLESKHDTTSKHKTQNYNTSLVGPWTNPANRTRDASFREQESWKNIIF